MEARKSFLILIALTTVLGLAGSAHAQPSSKCINDNVFLAGYKIRKVNIDGRYLDIPLPPKGADFLAATLESDGGHNKILKEVKAALDEEQNREKTPGATLNQIKGKLATVVNLDLVTQCVKLVEEEICETEVKQKKCVDYTIYAKSLRFDPNNPAQTILDAFPRSASPTFLSNVPKPLLVLNPEFGAEYDKRFGLSQNLEVSTNLLDFNELLESKKAKVKKMRLDVKAQAKKSVDKSFYDSSVGVVFSKFLPSRFVEKVTAGVDFSAAKLPTGDAEFFQNSLSFEAGVLLKPNVEILKNVILEAGYSRENNRFINPENTASTVRAKEDDFHFRALINGQVKGGVLRAGLWADSGKTTDAAYSYRRFAGLAGFAKDFGKGNQTFGLETMFGAGRVSGDIPEYAYFYGSNQLKNFIFEANDSAIMRKMPAGPLIRSFGNGQAVNNGSTTASNGSKSYWHFNFNLSIPFKKWSRPLIPNEDAGLDEDVPNPTCPIVTVRDLIKCQARSGETILAAIYESQGVSNAAEKAKNEFKGINSAINYLTDHANLYSLKPLFMFDAAGFNGPNGINKTRFGVGAGLQLTIVIAKFEAGYMRTVNPQPGDSRGNFIMRLYFQNLF